MTNSRSVLVAWGNTGDIGGMVGDTSPGPDCVHRVPGAANRQASGDDRGTI